MGVKIESEARCNLQAKKIPLYMSTDSCQPIMTISGDKKRTIKSGSNRVATIEPLELLSAHDIPLHAAKSCSI